MKDRCRQCSGTGRTPDVADAYHRVMAKAVEAEDDDGRDTAVRSEDELAWADVLALARFWRGSQTPP